MGFKLWTYGTAVLAVVGIAPWAVYLGGLGKLTSELTDYNFSQTLKQVVVMLEWYILSAQLINLLFVAIVGFAGGLRRGHTLLCMFLAVNSALLILQATERLNQIAKAKDDPNILADLLGLPELSENPLPYLRALAAGQIMCAAWNFFLAIFIGMGGTTPIIYEGKGAAHATAA